MNLFNRLSDAIFNRSQVTTESLYALAMSWSMDQGTLLPISPESAQKLNTVFSCVKMITDTYAIIVPKIRVENESGVVTDNQHDQNTLLKRSPNSLQSSIEFRIEILANYLYYGHGYAEIIRNAYGRPKEYKILDPNAVIRLLDSEEKLVLYEYTKGKVNKKIQISDMIDISDIYGKSRIIQNTSALQEYAAIRQYGTDMFKNGTHISGYIFGDKALDAAGRDALLKAFKTRYKNGEPAILPAGYKYEQMKQNVPMGDAAFVMAKTTTDRDICRIFGVPPTLVGVDQAADNKGEADFNSFLTTTMAPICTLIEAEFTRKIFRPKESNYFVYHDLTEAYRFSLKERMESYRIAIHAGFMNADEARSKIGMNPTDDGTGKEYMKPLNMIPASQWNKYYESMIKNKDVKIN